MAEFSVLELYKRAFGYVASPFSASGTRAFVPAGSAFDAESIPAGSVKEYNSIFGTPIFMPVVLEIPGLKWKCPNEPVVTIDLTKRVIETEIDSQDGSFKEGFSLGDYNVKIDGIIVNEEDWHDQAYPEAEVRKLRQIVEYKGSVKVYCDLLSIFNINEIAIMGFNMPAVPGEPSSAAYTISAKSDRNFDLEVKP